MKIALLGTNKGKFNLVFSEDVMKKLKEKKNILAIEYLKETIEDRNILNKNFKFSRHSLIFMVE